METDCLNGFLEFLLLLGQKLFFFLEFDVFFVISIHFYQDAFGRFLDFLYPPNCENPLEGDEEGGGGGG